jgi:hypothetical protein
MGSVIDKGQFHIFTFLRIGPNITYTRSYIYILPLWGEDGTNMARNDICPVCNAVMTWCGEDDYRCFSCDDKLMVLLEDLAKYPPEAFDYPKDAKGMYAMRGL